MAASLTARVSRHIVDVDLVLPLDTSAPVTVLFGPSGAGKSTLLRCLAGLDRPDRDGLIALGGEVWHGPSVHVPARRRQVGYLSQDGALFRHMSVDANVAYGLHRLPRGERPGRVADVLGAVGASHLSGRPARNLSGGEAQRVALARALAPRPRLLLLDEPLSALDGPTRTRLRTELRAILRTWATPVLLVTHDRAEALALGDRIAVIIDGRLHQVDTVERVFSRPATPAAAAAVGVENVVHGEVLRSDGGLAKVSVGEHLLTVVDDAGLRAGAGVLVCVRAEDIALEAGGPAHTLASPRNHLTATVLGITPDGALERVELDAGFPLTAAVTRLAREELDLRPGSTVTAAIKAPALHLIARP